MLSTVKRIEEDETRKAEGYLPDDGWKPAGPLLTEESAEALPSANPIKPQPDGAMPTIGHIVVYHLRDGDSRNRRIKFPAIVMDSDLETGTLKLWVIVDDGDTWMQDHVPARLAPEPGWELVALSSVAQTPEEIYREQRRSEDFLPLPDPDANVIVNRWHTVEMLREHIEALESRLIALEAKRGPGRPAKPKDE